MQRGFTNLTGINGFDIQDPANARQNNYAWSLHEFGDYIYVGTGRNIVYLAMKSMGMDPPDAVSPDNPVMDAEIWRYPKSGRSKRWERVFTANSADMIYGFRTLITYTDYNGRTALVAGGISLRNDEAYVLISYDGLDWIRIDASLPGGYNTRTMIEYEGVLYCGANDAGAQSGKSLLVAMTDFGKGFKEVPIKSGNFMPRGEIMSMAVMGGCLYIGTALAGGFGVWKSNNPAASEWELIVDKGAGDALNEWAMTMGVFDGYLYIGSAIGYGIRSVDPNVEYLPMKGFDIVRVDARDRWELIVGSEPISPTQPTTGVRGTGLYPSGFGNMFNAYCWQLNEYNGRLYVGSWDSALIYQDILESIVLGVITPGAGELSEREMLELVGKYGERLAAGNYRWLQWFSALAMSLTKYPDEHGFDLLSTGNGKRFRVESLNGFGNSRNYGARKLFSASDGKMYIGTANPYEGCEVWAYSDEDEDECRCRCRR